jgi:phage terminase large subunit-like protein
MAKSVKKQLQDLDALVKNIIKSTPVQVDESHADKEARITRLLNNWPEAMKYYFPNWASSDFAPFHIRGGNAVMNFKQKKNIFAWMIARDLAKTTYWQMMAIILNCRSIRGMDHSYKTGLWWSKTFTQSSEMIRVIRLQFEYNRRLIQDFGEFKTFAQWGDDKFVTAQGISWRALGKGQSPRGTKEEERRPDIIIGDDFDDDEEVLNENRLDKSYEWIMGALWPTMDVSAEALFVVLNNKIGEKSLMARLYEIADFKETINLLDSKGRPSWKRHSLADCQYMISKMGSMLAEREYFNNPITEGKVFRKEWIRDKAMPTLQGYVMLIAYLDPSFKSKKNADHKAWVLMGLKDGEYHVIKPYCDRATIESMVEWGYELHNYVRVKNGACELWMEEVFLQDILYKDFNAAAKVKGWPLPVQGDTRQKPDKDMRISSLAGYFERGEWYFNEAEKDNHHMVNLKFQFTSFQMGHTGIKKDGPDACEGAVWKILERIQTSGPPAWGKRATSKNKY